MGRYLDIAKEIGGVEPELRNLTEPEIESANARRLSGAGWKSKESFGGVVIWERPDTGCYVSEEMAIYLMKRSEQVKMVKLTESRIEMGKQTSWTEQKK